MIRGVTVEPIFGGTPSGPRQVSPEWRLGWGLLIINQQTKYFHFILPRNLLWPLFQAAR